MTHQIPPSAPMKDIVMHEMAAITASENGEAIDARGIENASFALELTTLDNTTGNETYDAKIQGRAGPDGTWTDIPGLTFTQVTGATSGGSMVPTAANAPGVKLPRFLRVAMTLGGTTPIATGRVVMYADRNIQGKQYEAEYMGG